MRYRDVLFIIFSIALTAFLLVCAFRGGHMIFDNIEKQDARQERVDNCIYMLKDRADADAIRTECERMFRR